MASELEILYEDNHCLAGLSVQAWRLASSIMAGARKPRGKITQPHRFGPSSATWAATARRAGLISMVEEGGLSSTRSRVTWARLCRYASGGTAMLPSQTVVGMRRCRRRKSATSPTVRVNWHQSVATGEAIGGTGFEGPSGV